MNDDSNKINETIKEDYGRVTEENLNIIKNQNKRNGDDKK